MPNLLFWVPLCVHLDKKREGRGPLFSGIGCRLGSEVEAGADGEQVLIELVQVEVVFGEDACRGREPVVGAKADNRFVVQFVEEEFLEASGQRESLFGFQAGDAVHAEAFLIEEAGFHFVVGTAELQRQVVFQGEDVSAARAEVFEVGVDVLGEESHLFVGQVTAGYGVAVVVILPIGEGRLQVGSCGALGRHERREADDEKGG